MTQPPSEFRQAIERICAGSEDAVWEFIESYGPHIQRVIRRRLNQRMRSKFDSVDFVQMVWASFFSHPQRIAEFDKPEELIRYLVSIARHKVIEESRRRLKYQQHNVKRECSLEYNDDFSPDRNQDTPSAIAIARERWRTIMSHQTERDRQIVQLRMSGATYVEIGRQLGIHERTVRQVISQLAGVG